MPPVFQIDFLQKVSKFEWIPCKYKKCGSDYTPIITPVRLSGFRRTQNVDSGQTIDQSIVFYRALVSFRPLVKINSLFIRQKADFIAKTTQRQMRTQKCAERTERWLTVLNLPLCYWSWIKKGCFSIIHEVVRPFSTPVLGLLSALPSLAVIRRRALGSRLVVKPDFRSVRAVDCRRVVYPKSA